MPRHKNDPKTNALRERGCLHPHPEKISDDLFTANDFFDPRDLLQVKYEMLRRVREGDHSISQAAASFGLSRPSFYQAQAAYEAGGLPALLPKSRVRGAPTSCPRRSSRPCARCRTRHPV